MIPKTIQTVENRKFPVEMDRKKTDLDSFRISHCRGRRRRPHSPWSPSRELWREEERDRGRRRRITTLWEAASCRLVRWWFPWRRKYDAFQSRGKGHSFCSSALLEFVRDGKYQVRRKMAMPFLWSEIETVTITRNVRLREAPYLLLWCLFRRRCNMAMSFSAIVSFTCSGEGVWCFGWFDEAERARMRGLSLGLSMGDSKLI